MASRTSPTIHKSRESLTFRTSLRAKALTESQKRRLPSAAAKPPPGASRLFSLKAHSKNKGHPLIALIGRHEHITFNGNLPKFHLKFSNSSFISPPEGI
jgi:hypothetical protein